MREILFRGKRLDNGEWVIGNYVYHRESLTDREGHYILISDGFGFSWSHVDPDAVERCTGLTDKNGVKIFEGDIIRGEGSRAQTDCFVIRWNPAISGFSAGEGKRVWPNLNQATVSNYEVIGDIHDNPELMDCLRQPVEEK